VKQRTLNRKKVGAKANYLLPNTKASTDNKGNYIGEGKGEGEGEGKGEAVKAVGEIQIKFSTYMLGLSDHLVKQVGMDDVMAHKAMKEMLLFINNNLRCNKCGCVLPDEEFYKQKAQFANRFRAQICKPCWKENFMRVRGEVGINEN